MTQTEYKRNNGKWFSGKKATVNSNIRNNAGREITQGEIVTISGKNGRGGFNIQSEARVYISRVHYKYVDLL